MPVTPLNAQILNVWKPVDRPIAAWPLALCDAATVEPDDLLVVGSSHPYEARPLQTLAASWSSRQEWYAVRDQTADEVRSRSRDRAHRQVTLIKQYDSAAQVLGVAPFAVHGCAHDRPPLSGQGGDERLKYPQSVEFRVLALHKQLE